MDATNEGLATALRERNGIVDVLTTDLSQRADNVDWVDGRPSAGSYTMLVLLDASFARSNPHREAEVVRERVHSAVPEEFEGATLVELMGHGTVETAQHEGCIAVAAFVEA